MSALDESPSTEAVSGRSPQRFLETAARIGDRLRTEAIVHDGRCTWLGDDVELVHGAWEVVHGTVAGELYSGTSGISLFLARLWRVTGDERLREVALGGARQALWLDGDAGGGNLGLYDGRSGLAWAAVELGELLNDAELTTAGTVLAGELADEILLARPRLSADLVGGSPGTLVALLALSRSVDDERLAEASLRLGEGLVAMARQAPIGWSWPSEAGGGGDADLCGLAHGASGVAHALLELHARTGEPRFRHAAVEATRYERSWFDRRQNGWPDLRETSHVDLETGEPLACPAHWCHGAVGIGLARLRAYELTGDRGALAEAGAALQAARAAAWSRGGPTPGVDPSSGNFSLCHGLGGTMELLLLASEVLGVDEHLALARRLGDQGIARAEAEGDRWACGVPGGGEAPGLMLGLAGIGACYLRLHDPSLTPPVGLPPPLGPPLLVERG